MAERHGRLFQLYNELLWLGDGNCCMGNKDVSEEQLEEWIVARLPKSKEWVREQLDLATRRYGERMDIIEQAERELDDV